MGYAHLKRLLIIGLDGLNWRLLDPLLEAGVMPHLERFRREGVWGPLNSVIPTHSATAWASFITGQNPARHGIVDFTVRQANGIHHHAKPDPATTLWRRAGQGGLRVGVLNFPVTYPPDPVNGFLVSGMLTPRGRTFTYPPTLGEELLAAVPDYRLDLEWQLYRGRERALVQDLTAMTQNRLKAACYLQERFAPDLLAVAFIAPDRLQHALWRHLDPAHPHHDASQAAALAGDLHLFYAALDDAVGRLVACAGDGTTVILLSDHGFQPVASQFRVDDWLTEHGWLVRQAGRSRLDRMARRLDSPWVRHIRRRLVKDISRHVAAFAPGGTIDWSRTVAFSPWTEQQGIRLNVLGREPQGKVPAGAGYELLREEMRQALLETTEPQTRQPVVAQVWKREELYAGPFLQEMPDLVFSLRPGFASSPMQARSWAATDWMSGDHSMEGMFIAWGPGVRKPTIQETGVPGRVADAELIDIPLLALVLLGQPVPGAMDGKVLTNVLDEDLAAAYPIHREPPAVAEPQVAPIGPPLTTEEEIEIREHLRGLGYL